MWKFLCRGWKESFERGLNLGRADVRVKKETQKTTYAKTVPCSLILSKKFRTNCHHEKNEDAKQKHQQGTAFPHDSWLGAFTFSSAFVLGWVFSHPYYLKKRFCKKDSHERYCSGQSLIKLITQVALAQPPIPLKSIVKEEGQAIVYGPPTAQEAIAEAADELLIVHNEVMGEIENRQGVDIAQGPDRTRAPRLFMSAIRKGSLPAAFNLGQCYENGIGVEQNFAEAARWYLWAAERGHSTAMYNLAVFYAHGWGGLDSDVKLARHWLELAAQKGQPEASNFLGLTDQSPPKLPTEDMKICGLSEKKSKLRDVSSDAKEIYDLAASYEKTPCDDSDVPHLILELYKMASDLGHPEAKSRFNLLQTYETIGLLSEFLGLGKCADVETNPPVSRSRIPFPRVI